MDKILELLEEYKGSMVLELYDNIINMVYPPILPKLGGSENVLKRFILFMKHLSDNHVKLDYHNVKFSVHNTSKVIENIKYTVIKQEVPASLKDNYKILLTDYIIFITEDNCHWYIIENDSKRYLPVFVLQKLCVPGFSWKLL